MQLAAQGRTSGESLQGPGETWWLSGGRSSVIAHWQLKPGALVPTLGGTEPVREECRAAGDD